MWTNEKGDVILGFVVDMFALLVTNGHVNRNIDFSTSKISALEATKLEIVVGCKCVVGIPKM